MATPSATTVHIVEFDPRWRGDFARLNVEWLRRWFVVEAFDEEVLGNPEAHILAGGGRILFALEGEGEDARAVGTVALRHEGNWVYELTKMAVEPGRRGSGIGLSIVREYVEAHGGTVQLVPRNGGAHFHIELPNEK